MVDNDYSTPFLRNVSNENDGYWYYKNVGLRYDLPMVLLCSHKFITRWNWRYEWTELFYVPRNENWNVKSTLNNVVATANTTASNDSSMSSSTNSSKTSSTSSSTLMAITKEKSANTAKSLISDASNPTSRRINLSQPSHVSQSKLFQINTTNNDTG